MNKLQNSVICIRARLQVRRASVYINAPLGAEVEFPLFNYPPLRRLNEPDKELDILSELSL